MGCYFAWIQSPWLLDKKRNQYRTMPENTKQLSSLPSSIVWLTGIECSSKIHTSIDSFFSFFFSRIRQQQLLFRSLMRAVSVLCGGWNPDWNTTVVRYHGFRGPQAADQGFPWNTPVGCFYIVPLLYLLLLLLLSL